MTAFDLVIQGGTVVTAGDRSDVMSAFEAARS